MSDMMSGLPGCRRVLGALVAQLSLLLFALVFSLFILLTRSVLQVGPGRVVTDLLFLLPLALFGATFFVLRSLTEPIELVWSINAKHRLKAWIYPALVVGAGVAIFGEILAAFGPSVSRIGAFDAAILPDVLAAAYAIPLAALAIFSAGALKRYFVMRRSVMEMTAMTGPPSSAHDDGLARIRASIATEAGDASTNARPNPQGFILAGLTSRPWHDPDSFRWIAAFKAAAGDIRREALDVLNLHRDAITIYKYPGLEGEHWKAFKLATRYHEIPDNLEKAPLTARLLKTIPAYPCFRDAMFSILESGGEIKPHRDVSNVFLTMHLGLITPEGGYLEVAGERRSWRAGEALVFDSSYEHRAINPASQSRLVLLVDFLHPEITERERAWVSSVRL